MPLAADPPPFAEVSASGHLRGDLAALYGVEVRDLPSGPVLGGQLLEPLERTGRRPVLVDLGWMPQDKWPQPARTCRPMTGRRLCHAHPTMLACSRPTTIRQARQFYTLDPAGDRLPRWACPRWRRYLWWRWDRAAVGLPDPAQALAAAAEQPSAYAITWYGLAGALLVIFVSYVRKGARA